MDKAADVAAYLARLETERGYSPHTIAGYRRDLTTLIGLHRQAGGGQQDWRGIVDANIRRWVAHLSRQGLSAKSLARTLSAWRGFVDAAGCPRSDRARTGRGSRRRRPRRSCGRAWSSVRHP